MYFYYAGEPYSFDEACSKFFEVFPKFANSHYYDLITYSCGLFAFLLLLFFRPTIKQWHRNYIMKKYGYDLFHREIPLLKPIMIYRLRNLVIPLFAGLFSMTLYSLISRISTRISMQSRWFWAAGLIPVAIYTIYEFLQSNILGWVFTLGVTALIAQVNFQYCSMFESHHKNCYTIKYTLVFFGIIGILKQFAPPLKDLLTLLKNKNAEKVEEMR